MKKLKKIVIFLLAALPLCPAARAQTAAAPSPESWLIDRGYRLIRVLSEKETKPRYAGLRRLAAEVFDQNEMPRLAMGRYWRELTPKQQADLKFLFFDYFVVMYGTTSWDLSDAKLKVTDKKPSGRDILLKIAVDTNGKFRLPAADGKKDATAPADENTLELMFALRETPDGFYIRDAKVVGQSVLMFLRSHLEKEYQSAAMDAEKLINSVRDKINRWYRAAEDMAKAAAAKRNTP